MTQIKIVGLGGSSNPNSSTAVALDLALASAELAGAVVERFDVRGLDLPFYEYGVMPTKVEPFVQAVRGAHGMIWSSPLYHGTVSGSFKNAIDWLELLSGDMPPYLSNKVIGLVATSGGDQALQAINTMEYIVRALRGWTLPLTAPISRADRVFDELGAARDPLVAKRLHRLGLDLVRSASLLAG